MTSINANIEHPIRLAHLTYHYRPIIGGQEVYIKCLNDVLSASGIECVVFQPFRRDAHAQDTVLTPRVRGVGRLIDGADEWVFAQALRIYSKRLSSFDVIISHYAFPSAYLGGIADKLIVLSHGIEWRETQKRWIDRLHEQSARKAFRQNTIVANDTDFLRAMGADISPGTSYFEEVNADKWFVPNCISTEVFRPGVEQLPEIVAGKVILVPRQITHDRGIDLAIKAFARMTARIEKDVTLYICGKSGQPLYLRQCKKLAADLSVQDRVVFREAVPHHEMPSLYASALVTLIPSMRREGTSLSALESMACGTPCVSTNVGGLRDLPTLQTAPDSEALANGLVCALRDRAALGEKQMKVVRSTFNLQNWGKAWLQVIRRKVGRCSEPDSMDRAAGQ